MKIRIISFLLYLLTLCCVQSLFSQTSNIKKITVTVIDAATGRPLNEAEVQIKGAMMGGKKRTTDAFGKAFFEITEIPFSQSVSIEVNDGAFLTGHKAFKETLNLVASQQDYYFTATLKSSLRGASVMRILYLLQM